MNVPTWLYLFFEGTPIDFDDPFDDSSDFGKPIETVDWYKTTPLTDSTTRQPEDDTKAGLESETNICNALLNY